MTDHKELILLRHAKAAHPDYPIRDFDRPLTKFGFDQADAIADWLEQAQLTVDIVLVSAATRTLQTIQPWRTKHPDIKVKQLESLYGATTGEILALVDAEPNARKILVVGHNPGIEYALHYLQSPDSNNSAYNQRMRPGDLVHLQQANSEKNWEPGKVELITRFSALR